MPATPYPGQKDRHLRLTRCSALLSALLPGLLGAAEETPPQLSPVVVTGSRIEHSSFDLPAAIDVLDRDRLRDGQARVNASEALVAVPGLVVQNRQNYAQDLQVSSRGFGARSAFGVRGVRLVADGIPASMPDGQGQLATFNLDQAERIEVMRGPFSAIYGNHAGGVLQLFSRSGRGAPTVEAGLLAGSNGMVKTDLNASGSNGALDYVLDASHFESDGYRAHSAATRDQGFAKLGMQLDADSRLTLTANTLRQHDTQDPLGLDWASAQRDPRGVAAAALSYNTRKSIDHVQGGLNYERRFGDDRLQITAYAGNRQVVQFQSIPKAVQQANAGHSGGVIDFDRDFHGLGLRWSHVRAVSLGRLTLTAGVDYEHSEDARRGWENFVGNRLGVQGALRRSEKDRADSLDPYVQAELESGAWVLSGGLRRSSVRFAVADDYRVNGNDSGSVRYRQTTPVLGVLYKASPALNFYASAARGFETPTQNELFYSGAGGGFNFGLLPAKSRHFEVGSKALLGDASRLNLAVFQILTSDELVIDAAADGRTSYRNASGTRRDGLEFAVEHDWTRQLASRFAFTHLRAIYDQGFSSASGLVSAGKRLPGVPENTLFADLVWKHPASGFSAALEAIYRSKVYVEDRNAQAPAPSYTLANLRFGFEQRLAGWVVKEFVRVDNLFDRAYIGSVVVGDGNQRYYEPAPGRNWLAGVSVAYTF